jgi:hypothetical protein
MVLMADDGSSDMGSGSLFSKYRSRASSGPQLARAAGLHVPVHVRALYYVIFSFSVILRDVHLCRRVKK